jgi:hypothetical protein
MPGSADIKRQRCYLPISRVRHRGRSRDAPTGTMPASSPALNGQARVAGLVRAVPPAGQVLARSVDAYFFQGRSISNG